VDTDHSSIVLFDGECPLCVCWSDRLRRWDRHGRLALLPLSDPRVARRFPELDPAELRRQIHVWDPGAQRWRRGIHALRHLSRRVPRLWWVAPLLHLPLSAPLWQRGYMAIAESRSCAVRPT
jgi:predicted DCC family thiol-disulfide oxidoreductase YuxK